MQLPLNKINLHYISIDGFNGQYFIINEMFLNFNSTLNSLTAGLYHRSAVPDEGTEEDVRISEEIVLGQSLDSSR